MPRWPGGFGADYHKRPVTIVGVLTGCLMFLADLVRHLDLPLRISLIKASSYRGAATTRATCRSIRTCCLTFAAGTSCCWTTSSIPATRCSKLVAYMREQGSASVRTVVFVRKHGRQEVPFEPDYCGFEIPDLFVVGYGLDYNDDYRHLPYLAVLPQ